MRGGPDFHIFSAGREPRKFWKNASYRRKKQMKSCEGAPDNCCEGTQKQVQLQRAPSQPSKFPGSFAAHETLSSPQNGRYGGHFRNIFDSPRLELRRSPGNFRAPSQFFAFRRKKQILPKSLVSSLGSAERTRFKMCQKSGPNHTPHSAERTIFSRSNSQKNSVPQKERIFG